MAGHTSAPWCGHVPQLVPDRGIPARAGGRARPLHEARETLGQPLAGAHERWVGDDAHGQDPGAR